MTYSCARDVYCRVSSGGVQTPGWRSCVSETSNLSRKEERDWGMVYIARQEDASSPAASVTWKFDFTGRYSLLLCNITNISQQKSSVYIAWNQRLHIRFS